MITIPTVASVLSPVGLNAGLVGDAVDEDAVDDDGRTCDSCAAGGRGESSGLAVSSRTTPRNKRPFEVSASARLRLCANEESVRRISTTRMLWRTQGECA